MSSQKQNGTERRTSERRIAVERRSDTMRAATGERREVEQRGMVESMTDALEDILRWERASERALRIAAPAEVQKPSPSSPDISASR
ncbi:hypothetical protein AKJ09_00952 [Labilithrix luteola]|uniref:Uncharacterized protein n=1 Tax=Labilithrix luteola TaxID=1391654 RepID=A0A0K1PL81_9BACT|nr:hypothetical protein [Labilithrix luteola]AKU94288.1 hypothetical protein AKJ09_00952 [Labilithrix luteola]